MVVFSRFRRDIFETFKAKANIVKQRHKALYWLSNNPNNNP